MAVQPWRKGIVTEIKEAAPGTNRYFIQVPDTDRFDFEPGQFVTLDLPIGEKTSERWRSYSIASAPDGTNSFELVIVKANGGKGTEFIFDQIKVGSEFTIRGPQGKFVLPESLDKDLFLICTGTGIAPFRSMLNHIYTQQIPHKNIYLVFGCRTKTDLLYYDEFRKLESAIESFTYVPTLSREAWEGLTGYVHAAYAGKLTALQPAYFFLCGWKEMIMQAKDNLVEMGYHKKDIHFELYG
jgi:ferredoxin-NADP reductase